MQILRLYSANYAILNALLAKYNQLDAHLVLMHKKYCLILTVFHNAHLIIFTEIMVFANNANLHVWHVWILLHVYLVFLDINIHPQIIYALVLAQSEHISIQRSKIVLNAQIIVWFVKIQIFVICAMMVFICMWLTHNWMKTNVFNHVLIVIIRMG